MLNLLISKTFFKKERLALQKENHNFHLVDPSPYPLLVSILLFLTVVSLVFRLNSDFYISKILLNISFPLFIFYFLSWFHDIIIESKYHHTFKVRHGLAYGMLLFIVSEVMFFFSFFWAFFNASISPAIQIGGIWPPKGLETVSFMGLPLLNTVILLLSGLSVTWAHKSVTHVFKFSETSFALFFTILLGFIFSLFQAEEYWSSPFSISDSVYGSTFFMATGFHGFHVIIGCILLVICLFRHFLGHFTTTHHFGLIAAIWYWHFVDVVWIFLFVSIYWWGSH